MNQSSGFQMLDISTNFSGNPGVIHPTLIWDGDTVILVDTGLPGQLAQIQEAMGKAGVPFEKLNKIIITHHDIDHIGGLAGILQALPGQVQVLAHEVEKDYIQGDKRPLKLAQMEANLDSLPEERKPFYQMLKAGFEKSKVPVNQTLTDGEVLPYLGGITVIFTPGHTLGHISLYLGQSKTLITGDALRVEGDRLAPSPATVNYDLGLYKDSLKKLASYDIDRVISYHGGLYEGPASRQLRELAEE